MECSTIDDLTQAELNGSQLLQILHSRYKYLTFQFSSNQAKVSLVDFLILDLDSSITIYGCI
jgi:hypothetical protein